MCLSRIGQIIYGVAILVALALTLAGAFSPGWRIIEERLEGTTMNPRDPKGDIDQVKKVINSGLFSFLCIIPGEKSDSTATSAEEAKEYCKNWWKNQPTWEKIVAILVLLTIFLEVVALVYNFITFCCCCFRGHALKPLAPLALACFIFLGIAVIIFAANNKKALDGQTFDDLRNSKNTVGYSFFLECGALAVLLINVVVGSVSACLGDKWL